MYSPSIVNYLVTTGSWYKKYTAFLKIGQLYEYLIHHINIPYVVNY